MVAHNAIPILRQLKKSQRASLQKCSRSLEMPQRSGNAPPPAIRTPGFCKRLIHPPCHIHYRSSSMKAIGIRCWPDSHHALPGCPSEGAERRGKARKGAVRACERPLPLSGQSPARRPTHSPRPLSPREHPPAGVNGRVSPSSCYAQVLLRPALRPRPTHWTRCQAAPARTVCLQQPTPTCIDRLQPPHGYASG